MNIRTAEFVVSNTNPSACPPPDKPEFAFIGRSNVGKSSLINLLVNRKNLAKTSSTPGKTQTINHFVINGSWFLVDLPGYGYASVSRSKSQAWAPMITTYLLKRTNLVTTFVLIDPRLEPQKIDVEFINWMGQEGLPFAMVFTKADKLSRNALAASTQAWKKKLGERWEELPPLFATSSTDRRGKEQLLEYIAQLLPSGA
ncbi:MAG: YihA family ribosome biogenesis GTP-binding protein [Cyclobacteriaceae bacterium]|nr:YihA family ribosome biogenesis GTP-binding protein [Cyclobacteriaceae bacterium]